MAKKSASKKTAASKATSPYLVISQPISVWERDIKADSAGLFKSLGKAVWHLGSGKHWDLAADIGDAAAALGLKADAGGLAWLLIKRSLLRAMYGLTEEAWLHRNENLPQPEENLEEEIDKEIGRQTLEVSPDFFRQPGSLPFLEGCVAWFKTWLQQRQFEEPKANSISKRLSSYFVYALNQEWREHDVYAPIVRQAVTPFSQAGDRERSWDQYEAWLNQELDGPMFGEPFSLRQLFIPLRAYYLEPESKEAAEGSGSSPSGHKEERRIASMLFDSLHTWLGRQDKEDAFRILSGGPGSGKSSVAKMFTADVLAKKTTWRALYLPLHRLNYTGELVPAIEKYLQDTDLLPGYPKPFDQSNGEPQLLLIFDGLDELAMLGKMAQETASQFIRAVKDLVRDRNTTKLRLKVIITGRTVIMQSLESEFRKEGAVLHLCNYYFNKNDTEEARRYKRGWSLLTNQDQRHDWWRKYGLATGQGYQKLPEHLDRNDLVEISSEPLLNYLLALANQAKTLDFAKNVTQNQIYASLINELHERRWGQGENFAVKGLQKDHFSRILEEIAVAAWHGDGRKTTVGEIKQHCQVSGITKMLEIFQEGAEGGVLRLLTAFFFRQAGTRADENAFEFTHKSFGEYLVARRLIRMLGIMSKKVEEQAEEFTGWDDRKCLEEWARLCGPSPLTERQLEFFQNEMHGGESTPQSWQDLLTRLINVLLRQGMPMERLALPDFKNMDQQSRNAESALLLGSNACARFTGSLTLIDWPESTSAAGWLMKLRGPRGGVASMLPLSLSHLNLINQTLILADMHGVNFQNSDLRGTDLTFCILRYANLQRTLLQRAFLQGAILEYAKLHEANLQGADLQGANLRQADLRETNLQMTTLRSANLHHTDLQRSSLQEANLQGANLRGADLQGANLQGANLQGADLQGANLRGANLQGANLRRAKFYGAKFHEANLQGADLLGARLQSATGLPDFVLQMMEAERIKAP